MTIMVRRKFEEHLIDHSLRASALIPVMSYAPSQHLFLLDDNTVGMGFLCLPLSGADDKMQERVNGFLNQDYPKNTIIQFCLFRSPDISGLTNSMLGLRDHYPHHVFTQVIKERVDFLEKHTHEKLVASSHRGTYDNGVNQDLKLMVTVKVPINSTQPTQSEIRELID